MKPDILLIMPDQMRGDAMSIAGHPTLLTPLIDSIGHNGTFFRRGYSTCASCIPARRSLLTGCSPSVNGMVGYREGCPIPDDFPTLPQLLSGMGYRTVITGRYMHQSPYENSYGFETRILGSTYIKDDEYAGFLEEALPGTGGVRGVGLSFNGWQAKPWPYREDLHPTNWTIARAREVIADDDDRPLFLTTSFYAPHPPLFPPAFYMERNLSKQGPDPSVGSWVDRVPMANRGVDAHHVRLEGEALDRARAGYYGLIDHIDDQLYWLITDFKSRSAGKRHPWLIIFTSDHGEMLGDHDLYRKCEPYEGSSCIPFLIEASPELGFATGNCSSVPVCLEDILPTILQVTDTPVPEHVDGLSLVDILRGGDVSQPRILHGEHAPIYDDAQGYHFLTDGHMKYIWRPHDGSEQLFNLETDPRELQNLVERDEGNGEKWRGLLVRLMKDRPEGFVEDGILKPGRVYPALVR